jgi:hypothetical protein
MIEGIICPSITTKTLIVELLNIDNDIKSAYNANMTYDDLDKMRDNIIRNISMRIEDSQVDDADIDIFNRFYFLPSMFEHSIYFKLF